MVAPLLSLILGDTENQDSQANHRQSETVPSGADKYRVGGGGTTAVSWARLTESVRWLCHLAFGDSLDEELSSWAFGCLLVAVFGRA